MFLDLPDIDTSHLKTTSISVEEFL